MITAFVCPICNKSFVLTIKNNQITEVKVDELAIDESIEINSVLKEQRIEFG